jgi:hypothetical protein
MPLDLDAIREPDILQTRREFIGIQRKKQYKMEFKAFGEEWRALSSVFRHCEEGRRPDEAIHESFAQ